MGVRPSSCADELDDLAWAGVLVVDDQPANVMLLERLLARMGLGRVVGVTDGSQAISRFEDMAPDLVLLDLHMPRTDGLDVLDRMLKVAGPDEFVPVVILTADATDRARQAALAAGATDFLTKPLDHGEVVLRVRNLLRARAMHRALRRHNDDLRAELAEKEAEERQAAAERARHLERITEVLETTSITMVFQPIFDLFTDTIVGFEALARFPRPPIRPPNEWFAEAALVGLATELELAAVRMAVAQVDLLPASVYLALNVSPATLEDPRLAGHVATRADRVVLEITEHDAILRYDQFIGSISDLRQLGVRLAVDDAGAGYAGLRRILAVQPDIIKLDIGLTSGLHADPARRAMAASLVSFGADTGAAILAEGIEQAEELAELRRLGVRYGQGFYLGRPGALPLDQLRIG